MTALERLHDCLTVALSPQQLEIVDDSHKHIGHPGAVKGGHYRVFIVSDAFSGRPLIARHRMVYEAMPENLRRHVHALSIVARAPSEVTDSQSAAGSIDTGPDRANEDSSDGDDTL